MCIGSCTDYTKVIFTGIVSATIISSIYSFLTNVDSLVVTYIPPEGDGYCDNISYDANSNCTDYNSAEYVSRCQAYVDLSTRSIFYIFTSFRNYLIILILCTAIWSASSIIHDCVLINNKNNLNSVAFFPQSLDEFYLSSHIVSFWESYEKYEQEHECIAPTLMLLFLEICGIPYLLTPLVDVILAHTIYPILKCCKSPEKSIQIIGYMSEAWVGVARACASIATICIVYWSVFGLSAMIEPANIPNCECQCYFTFKQNDFSRLLFVTSLFVIVNVRFLWSWTMNAKYDLHYLYLVSYTLPIKWVNIINPNKLVGNMMIEPTEHFYQTRVIGASVQVRDKYELLDDNADVEVESLLQVKEHEEEERKKTDDAENIQTSEIEKRCFRFSYKGLFFGLSVFFVWIGTTGISGAVLYTDGYNFSSWIQHVMTGLAIVSGFSWWGLMFYLCLLCKVDYNWGVARESE
eukprot:289799_1